jgi:transcriptional regulator
MYVPPHFQSADGDNAAKAAQQSPFALIISNGASVPEISHVPVFFDTSDSGERMVSGHFAKANPHVESLRHTKDVVVVFNGPHTYVSPTWYDSQAVVPTWNYVAVHMTGTITFDDSRQANADIVTRLTETFEAGREPEWQVDFGVPAVERMLDFIVSFRVSVDSIEAKFKLNQNRTTLDREGVARALAAGNEMERTVASWMAEI